MGAQVASGGLSPTSGTTLLCRVDLVLPGKRVPQGAEGAGGRCLEALGPPVRRVPGSSRQHRGQHQLARLQLGSAAELG